MHSAKATLAVLALMLAAQPAQSEPTLAHEEDIEVVVDDVSFDFVPDPTVTENELELGLSIYTGQDQSSWLNLPSTTPAVVLYSRGQFIGSCSVVEPGEPLCPTNPTSIPCPFPAGALRYRAQCSGDLDLMTDPPELTVDPRALAEQSFRNYLRADAAFTPGDGLPRVFLTVRDASRARQLKGKQLDSFLAQVGKPTLDVPVLRAECEWERDTPLGGPPDDCNVEFDVDDCPDGCRAELWLRE